MSKLVESVIAKHLPSESSGYVHKQLTGGISSEMYKVEPIAPRNADSAIALTIIRDPLLWWKVEQEFVLRHLMAGDVEVLLPRLYDAGFDVIEGAKIAFIIREFVQGTELDTVLEQTMNTPMQERDFTSLSGDLGYRLGVMHTHGGAVFGQLARSKEVVHPNWANFVLSEIDNEVRLTYQISPDMQLGKIKAYDVQALLPGLQKLVGTLQSSLLAIVSPGLAHGDAHFRNIIAGKDQSHSVKVKSFIDTEEALGGDPEIDVSFIENWLHFSTYKAEFFKKRNVFRSHYASQRVLGPRYLDRRLIYHGLRSLSFLRTVFGFDAEEFLSANPKNGWYVFLHLQILRSLAEGGALEDVAIPSLL